MLRPITFAQLFSTHGTIMIFFVAMPLLIGLINFVLPQQLGARDMAFPVLNQVSLGLTAVGAALVMISLLVGKFGTGGWTMYPPYTGMDFSPGEGVDYWLWAILISGRRLDADGDEFRRHHFQGTRAGHALHAHAAVLLDQPVRRHHADLRHARADRFEHDAGAGPVSRFPFLHECIRRQHDELRQHLLDVRPPGSLHPDPAGLRCIFGNQLHLLWQAALRLHFAGDRQHEHCHHQLHRVAAPLFSPWARARASTSPLASLR